MDVIQIPKTESLTITLIKHAQLLKPNDDAIESIKPLLSHRVDVNIQEHNGESHAKFGHGTHEML